MSDYIECPKCHKKSYSQGDIQHKFCVDCGWHVDIHRHNNLVKFLEDNLYTNITHINGMYVGILKYIFTYGVCVGLTEHGLRGRFCFDNRLCAELFLAEWDGETFPVIGEDGCTAIKF